MSYMWGGDAMRADPVRCPPCAWYSERAIRSDGTHGPCPHCGGPLTIRYVGLERRVLATVKAIEADNLARAVRRRMHVTPTSRDH